MITKANSIESAPTMFVARRIQLVTVPVASVECGGAVLFEEAVPSTEPRPGLAFRPTGDQTGEFWETVSYLAFWLCGWIGIGLCFL